MSRKLVNEVQAGIFGSAFLLLGLTVGLKGSVSNIEEFVIGYTFWALIGFMLAGLGFAFYKDFQNLEDDDDQWFEATVKKYSL